MQAESIAIEDEFEVHDAPVMANQANKKVVVAILLGLLMVAILTQPDKKSGENASVATLTLKSHLDGPPLAADKNNVDAELAARFAEVRPLSRINYDVALQSTVFAPRPTPIDQKVAAPIRVQAVYGSGVSQSALVGTSIVHSGEPLPNGRKVLNVTLDGIQLAQ